MEKSQREYYLNEQMKAIQKELGDLEDAPNEIEDLAQRIEKAGMPKDGQGQGTGGIEQAENDVADVGRSHRGAQLYRLAGQRALEKTHQDSS
jgi:ATP-dependent Lon protease